jgi:hypothetical protein
METPVGVITFLDPTAGISYDELTEQQQRDRNVLRNKVFGQMFCKDLHDNEGSGDASPPAPPKTKAGKPKTSEAAKPRRSQRISTTSMAEPHEDDMDVDGGRPQSPPASASEPHTPLPNNDMEVDAIDRQSTDGSPGDAQIGPNYDFN